MLASLVPIFRNDLTVAAYYLYAQKENYFEHPHKLGSGRLDGAGNIAGIEVLNNVSIDSLSKDSMIFILVNNVSIFADISGQFAGPKNRIMLIVDSSVQPQDSYINRLNQLKAEGYMISMRHMKVNLVEQYKEMLKLFDYLFIDCEYAEPLKQAQFYKQYIPGIKLVCENVSTFTQFETLKESKMFELFEGEFFRIPVNRGDREMSPLKINYLSLLNEVNKPDYDLPACAAIISKDPAITVSLLEVVNKLTLNSNISSIKQATALLGQRELKRWINTSIIKDLCKDKPNEVIRLSLIRAKFAEKLAPCYGLAMRSEELFLMGLFSVMDIVMDMPMEEALSKISITDEIKKALISGDGKFGELYHFLLNYEAANWQEVSRLMVLDDMNMEEIYKSYLEALKWYKDMFL